jgi:hypothetical protein
MKFKDKFTAWLFSSGLLLIFVFLSTGCKKFVEIGTPSTQIVASNVFSDGAAATSAQTVIYTSMYKNQESYNLALYTGLLGDELKNYSSSLTQIQYYTNSLAAVNSPGPWATAYNYIYEANAIIEGLNKNTEVPLTVRRQLTGEAQFVRAFWHFYLTNLYGDIPIITTSNYLVNAVKSRSPQAQVYQQIISDLKDASNLLNSKYVDATDSIQTSERVRPTKWAAQALLARTYLYTGDYANAETQATSVISNTTMYWLPKLDSVFLANNGEAIWQISTPLPNTFNTWDGAQFILKTTPRSSSISTFLFNSFESGDLRKTHWIGTLKVNASNIYYFPNKYKSSTASPLVEYTMVLRLAEQFLIRAEARAQQGNLLGSSGSISDLNAVRARAGLGGYAGSQDKASVLAAILHERQVELFTEWGHRWFDLIRTSNINTVMDSVAPVKKASWQTTDVLYPIGQSQIAVDPNLSQNSGY